MIAWQMTSRDPKMSRSWPRLLWSLISQQRCEIHGRFILTTNRKPHLGNPVVTWPMTSRDPKGQSRDPNTFKAQYLKNRARWLDRNQSCTRWSTEEPVSRVCSRSRSKVTWYGHFCDVTKCLLYSTFWRSVSTCTHFMKYHYTVLLL